MARPVSNKPTDTQLANLTTEATKSVKRIMLAWPRIRTLIKEMDRGYPAGRGDGAGSKGTTADPVGNLVTGETDDATADYRQWIDDLKRLLVTLFDIDNQQAKLLDTGRNTGRTNTVATCAECGNPAPKVKRIDNQPYCADTCYRKLTRAA